jgi:hypothetical protein
MRKESLKIARAFAAGVAASAARTSTDGQAMFLHGNLIAKREPTARCGSRLPDGAPSPRATASTPFATCLDPVSGFISATTSSAYRFPMARILTPARTITG